MKVQSKRTGWPHSKSIQKDIGGLNYQMGYACDLVHGRCWMVRVWDYKLLMFGSGFSKNKFTATRMALKELNDDIVRRRALMSIV